MASKILSLILVDSLGRIVFGVRRAFRIDVRGIELLAGAVPHLSYTRKTNVKRGKTWAFWVHSACWTVLQDVLRRVRRFLPLIDRQGLPQLDAVLFRVPDPRKTPVGVVLAFGVDADPLLGKLLQERV